MKIWLFFLFVGVGMMAAASSASAYMLDDGYDGDGIYYGGNAPNKYDDIVGSRSIFEIKGLDAHVHGSDLTVKIYTNFDGDQVGVYEGLTKNRTGIGFGDLFLSVNGWSPYGSAGDYYKTDTASNGTHWEYAFVLDNPNGTTGGVGDIYRLPDATTDDHNPGAVRSDAFLNGGTWRRDQAVAADTTEAIDKGDGEWTVSEGLLTFTLFDFASFDSFDPDNLGLHWTMYCANDVIQGRVSASVPAPNAASLALLALVLVGVGGFIRRRKGPTSKFKP